MCWPTDETRLSQQRTIDRINKDFQLELHVVYADNYFGLVHRYPFKLSTLPFHSIPFPKLPHIRQLFAFMADVFECVCVCVILSRTCIRQLAVQFIQYINFNNIRVHIEMPLYNYFRLLQTNPASKTSTTTTTKTTTIQTTQL